VPQSKQDKAIAITKKRYNIVSEGATPEHPFDFRDDDVFAKSKKDAIIVYYKKFGDRPIMEVTRNKMYLNEK